MRDERDAPSAEWMKGERPDQDEDDDEGCRERTTGCESAGG